MQEPRSCGFLIVKGKPISEFLLMEHPSRWDLPKGHVDYGETDMECALRELEEETGIRESDLEIFEDFVHEVYYDVNAKRYGGTGYVKKTMRIFMGRLTADVKIKVTEHDGYRWFPWKPPHNIQPRAIDPLLKSVEEYLDRQAKSD